MVMIKQSKSSSSKTNKKKFIQEFIDEMADGLSSENYLLEF